jgi:hypothetical protein
VSPPPGPRTCPRCSTTCSPRTPHCPRTPAPGSTASGPAWSAELASAGIEDTLDHADLHDGQLFHPAPGRFTFFDWGDATVSHPFCSLRIPAERACDRYGPQVLPRLLDAYLEPWTGTGRTAADLRRAARLAWRLSALGRAASWGRMFPDTSGARPGAEQGAQWLLELFNEPPF